MGRADFAWADALRRTHFPPARNVVRAHISLFHHLPPARLAELERLVRELTMGPPPAAMLEAPRSLGRGVAFDVRSPELLELRDVVAERFAADLIPQDRAKPRLHITVQNKVDPATARATLAVLAEGFVARPLSIAGVAIWEYLGGPWRPLSEYRFRGRGA